MLNNLYSIRMRGAEGGPHEHGGRHISGGERLGQKEELQELAKELLDKSLHHSRGDCDFIQIVIEKLMDDEIQRISPLPISSEQAQNVKEGRKIAMSLLASLGISDEAIKNGIEFLKQSTHQRGAIIADSQTGQRLDNRGLKGVRASRMDWSKESWEKWSKSHAPLISPRIREAIALASKVTASPYTVAELCWSDDLEYTTGYVASSSKGYIRIPHLKNNGEDCGGRIFFIKHNISLDDYITYMETTPVCISYEDKADMKGL